MSGEAFDLVIVGAGFAGMYMLHRARGLGLKARVLEQGSGVGGTWYWNRYPGARCDIESMQYCYQFSDALQQEWDWSERYSPQAEILSYANHVADRLDLRRDIVFDTKVEKLAFNDETNRWTVETDNGAALEANWVVMATGCLSVPNMPSIEGRETFEGEVYQTGRWSHHPVSFRGKRVAVIGTGSSGIQSIPLIARECEQLFVFQRTPHYSVPANNRPLDAAERQRIKANYPTMRKRAWLNPNVIDMEFGTEKVLDVSAEERERAFEARWQHGGLVFMGAFADLMQNERANDTAAEFVRRKIRSLVQDPQTAQKLCPDYIIGAKRLCVDTDYFATYNKPHVHLINLREQPIERITATGIQAGNQSFDVDAIVYATGFDAMTGALLNVDMEGVGGITLKSKWTEGPKTYLGLMIAGFPNLFAVTGPGSPSVLTNMLPTIEQHVNWIADCLHDLRAAGKTRIEAEEPAERAWDDHVQEVGNATLKANAPSWYTGENISGKPRLFMPYLGGMPSYIDHCKRIVENGYEGFKTS